MLLLLHCKRDNSILKRGGTPILFALLGLTAKNCSAASINCRRKELMELRSSNQKKTTIDRQFDLATTKHYISKKKPKTMTMIWVTVAIALLDEQLDVVEGTDVLVDLNAGPCFGH